MLSVREQLVGVISCGGEGGGDSLTEWQEEFPRSRRGFKPRGGVVAGQTNPESDRDHEQGWGGRNLESRSLTGLEFRLRIGLSLARRYRNLARALSSCVRGSRRGREVNTTCRDWRNSNRRDSVNRQSGFHRGERKFGERMARE